MKTRQRTINYISSLLVLTACQAQAGSVVIDAIEQYAHVYTGFPNTNQEITSGLGSGVSAGVAFPSTLPYQPSSTATQSGSVNSGERVLFNGAVHSQSRIDNRWVYTDRTGAATSVRIDFTVNDEPVRFNASFVAEVTQENLNPGLYGTDRSIALVRIEPDTHQYVSGHGPFDSIGTGDSNSTWSYLIDPGQYFFQFGVSATPYNKATFYGTENLTASVDVNYGLDVYFTELNGGGVNYDAVLPLQGDLDGDGFVGITDLNLILGAWNLSVPLADPLADPSGDGYVGIEDLNTVLGNWNAGTPPTDGTNIPEPGSVMLVLGLVLAGKCVR